MKKEKLINLKIVFGKKTLIVLHFHGHLIDRAVAGVSWIFEDKMKIKMLMLQQHYNEEGEACQSQNCFG